MIMPMLSSGCRMVGLLGRHNNRMLLADHTTMVTIFGHRHRHVNLSIHEDTRAPPVFVDELPVVTSVLHRDIASGVVSSH